MGCCLHSPNFGISSYLSQEWPDASFLLWKTRSRTSHTRVLPRWGWSVRQVAVGHKSAVFCIGWGGWMAATCDKCFVLCDPEWEPQGGLCLSESRSIFCSTKIFIHICKGQVLWRVLKFSFDFSTALQRWCHLAHSAAVRDSREKTDKEHRLPNSTHNRTGHKADNTTKETQDSDVTIPYTYQSRDGTLAQNDVTTVSFHSSELT